MDYPYHEGEIEIQTKAGVRQEAERMIGMIRNQMPSVARQFLIHQHMVVVATVDSRQQVWVSVLCGDQGFMRSVNEKTIAISAMSGHSMPGVHLIANPTIGLLAIDLELRRRMRVNGKGRLQSDGSILVHAEQIYSNCPKYIHARRIPEYNRKPWIHGEQKRREFSALTEEHQDMIGSADTFFIGSWHPESGGDVSHRGGRQGFVDVRDNRTIRFPDYKGNGLFNTIGNLSKYSACGLLFPDFEQGHTLQLTGRAKVLWEERATHDYPDAERVIEFQADIIIHSTAVIPDRWKDLGT